MFENYLSDVPIRGIKIIAPNDENYCTDGNQALGRTETTQNEPTCQTVFEKRGCATRDKTADSG